MDTGEAKQKFEEADLLYRNEQFLQCLEVLDELDRAFPLKKSIMLSMARCLYRLNRTDESLEVCDRILDTYEYPSAERLKNRILGRHSSHSEAGLHNSSTFRPLESDSTPAYGALSDSSSSF